MHVLHNIAMRAICNYFLTDFQRAAAAHNGAKRRVGAELKFPLVNADGTAASLETVRALWRHLSENGWRPVRDEITGEIVGARKPGPQNDHVASCETGYCKVEFSLAHVDNLFDLQMSIDALRQELKPFSERHGVYFLGYGIHPITPPGKRLMINQSRTSVWDKVFRSNRHIALHDGDDMHLFTVNTASHVHLSVVMEEAVPAVNVLNGLAGAQIALTAHSNIWRGAIDPRYKCVSEKFWDWWVPEAGRIGVPERPFESLQDYVRAVSAFRPVYVKRNGKPVVLKNRATFEEYYRSPQSVGTDTDGREVCVAPEREDIELHNSCYWYCARISRYYTVENRVNDQQPPGELISVAALTLGLVSALPEAVEEIAAHEWYLLRASREVACQSALAGNLGRLRLAELAGRMLEIARLGLRRRKRGEEVFLASLERRLREGASPADEAQRLFDGGGVEALIDKRSL